MTFEGELSSAGAFHTWKKRSFILEGGELRVQRKHGRRVKLIFTLDRTTHVDFKEKKTGIHYHITIRNGRKELRLRSKDRDLAMRWVLELRTAVFQDSSLTMEGFNIIAVIGRGFYGKVMLVASKQTQELFAIKTLHKERLIQAGQLQIVMNERFVLAKVNSPFIVSLKFAFQSATKFYLGLEYVPGGDMMKLLASRRQIPLQDVKIYVFEIALALDAMHSAGVVYRDLKPENILIGADGHVKLVDFGLSKDISEETTTNTFCGTAAFMAPEVILLKKYSYEVDWWALGVLTYELVFGKNPFHSDNKAKMYVLINSGNVVFPAGCDTDVADFIRGLLTKDPSSRFGMMDVEKHPFLNEYTREEILAKKVDPSYRPVVTSSQDVRNFDDEYTNEPPLDSLGTLPLSGEDQRFIDFSYSGI